MAYTFNPFTGKFDTVYRAASEITIVDIGVYYTGTDVEAALQEIGTGTTLDARYVNVTGDTMTGVLQVNANILIGGSNNELRFYEGANYVGFEAPALSADKIWVLPAADGSANDFLQTDGAGNLTWAAGGSSPWQTTSNVANLVASTDNVTVGSATAGGKLFIDGDANEIQLQVQAHSTQTANIVEIQNSSGTVLSGVDERGILFSDGGIDVNSVYIGNNAGNIGHTNAQFNVGIGTDTLSAITTGDYNVAIGNFAGKALTTGSANVALGANALLLETTGINSVAIGTGALANQALSAGHNTAIGVGAGNAITTATRNTAIGASALNTNTTSNDNIAIGYKALELLSTSSSNNVAIGNYALGKLASGADSNMAIGYNAGANITTGDYNTAIGSYALDAETTGSQSTAIGFGALSSQALSTGTNTAIGYQAGIALTTGNGNIFIGNYPGSRQTTNSNLFIVDNQQRADVATELTNSILYGVMAAAPANQSLRINADILGSVGAKIGDGGTTNYTQIDADGDITQHGTARIDWTKKTANGAAVTGFTTASAVADLQTANDGNLYTATEVAGGGNYLIVDFASVTAFNWVKVLGYYNGNSAHNIQIEVEITPFDGSTWHTFDSIEHQSATTNTMQSHDFFIPSDTAYINSGVVKIRFLHSASTSASHTLVLDEVALYQ